MAASKYKITQDHEKYTVTCPYRQDCVWKSGLLYNYGDHVNMCNWQILQCYCKELLLKGNLIAHLREECPYRMLDGVSEEVPIDISGIIPEGVRWVTCPLSDKGCPWGGQHSEYNMHRRRCNYNAILCVCGQQVQKKEFIIHLQVYCKCLMFRTPGPGITP